MTDASDASGEKGAGAAGALVAGAGALPFFDCFFFSRLASFFRRRFSFLSFFFSFFRRFALSSLDDDDADDDDESPLSSCFRFLSLPMELRVAPGRRAWLGSTPRGGVEASEAGREP